MPQAQMTRQAQQQQAPGNFNADTRQSIQNMPQLVPPTAGTAGQISRQELPQSGFLSAIWLLLTGTTTTAGASSTTVLTYPQPPWGFLRRIKVYNNQGVELWNTSGYGGYLYQRTQRSGFDPDTRYTTLQYASTNGGSNSRQDQRYLVHPTSLGASASETWKCAWYLPIAWGPSLQAGLQMLQDNAIRYILEVTWGDTTDLYVSTTGTVTLSNITLTPILETFAMPEDANNMPDLSFSKFVIEELQSLSAATGDNTYKFTTGNMLLKLIQELYNGATSAPVDAAAITQLKLFYAQTQVPYLSAGDPYLFRQRILLGQDMPQGVYCWLFDVAMGLPELPTTRDIMNTVMLTDLQTVFTTSGLTLSNGNLRTIKEMLVANRP